MNEIGIVSYGGSIPRKRIKAEEIAKVWGKEGERISKGLGIIEKSVPSIDQDTATISVEAARAALCRSQINPQDIGGTKNIGTSIDLLRYINTTHAGKFITGAAYNPYNPMPFESNRLREKNRAGAKFVITQPVIGKDSNIDSIFSFGMPVIVEAWMSKNLDLLFKSIRKQKDERALDYDPIKNLHILHDGYPDSCIYLSMLGFKKKWGAILPRF